MLDAGDFRLREFREFREFREYYTNRGKWFFLILVFCTAAVKDQQMMSMCTHPLNRHITV